MSFPSLKDQQPPLGIIEYSPRLLIPYPWEVWQNRPFVYIEKVLDLWVQLMKNGGKN